MKIEKLLEMLGVDKLDEADATKIQEKLENIIEVKAVELSKNKIKEEKEKLVEEYEEKFEEYKEDVTSKFSNFVDSILEEEMVIPKTVLEFAKKGELYNDLIEQFKIRLAVDEDLLSDEVKNLLKESKDEIIKLREDKDTLLSEKLEIELDAQKLSADLYLRKICEGLTEAQKTKVFDLLDGITEKEEIDKKFKIIIEADDEDEDEDEDDDKKKKDDDEEDEDDDKKKDEGKGKIDGNGKRIDEDNSPFNQYLKGYIKTLKENKIP